MAFSKQKPRKNSDKSAKPPKANQKKFAPTFKEKPKQSQLEDNEISALKTKYTDIDPLHITSFADFPLSQKTQKGLRECNFTVPTAIQKEAIGPALLGKDVLGAAITGSGKTLAFLVPICERLFAHKWSRMDGVGAIIISPTRELAYQIFESLKKVGKHHDFSAGLIIGGKNLKFERTRMDQCNVIICTPGRLLQHMDENPLFDSNSMQVLVLDEADRCLDMGFEQTMNAIIENLPPGRQTLLFSATQTRSVKDLARLSLRQPVYVAPHEQAAHSTPATLQQNYVVVELQDKITMLWSFIKNHLRQKCIVFLSSCKQVKYIYEIFCKLRPGTSVIALYGTLHQDRRMAIYNEFCRKSNVVLFATDIASRGLDFPVVNWVIQLDCPEDATAYIHRAGRTARHSAHGESLLVLMPSEEQAMVNELRERKIPIEKIVIDPRKMFSPRAKMEAFLAQSQDLKASAQRAFVAYIKSVALMRNKKCFDVAALDTDAFAHSLGLAMVPRVRFLQRQKRHQTANRDRQIRANADEDDGQSLSEEDDEAERSEPTTSKTTAFGGSSDEDDDDGGLIKIKRKDHEIVDEKIDDDTAPMEELKSKSKAKPLSKAALAKRVIKKRIAANRRTVFDEAGSEVVDTAKQLQSDMAKDYETAEDGGIDIDRAKDLLRAEDKFDKQRFKLMVKAKHQETKKKRSKKAGEQEEQDEFGTDESDEEGPDLSWVPDPDKVFNRRSKASVDDSDANDSDVEHRQVVNSSDESEDEVHRPPKKLVTKQMRSKRQTWNEEEPPAKKVKSLAAKLTVNEAEMLAMQLLGGGS